MNRFFNENTKKQIMAEDLISYLETSVEGILYPATRKIYIPEGQMIFATSEKTSKQTFIRDGLSEALMTKPRKNLIYPEIWKALYPDISSWRFVGFKTEESIEEIILIFIVRDFSIEREVLEVQLQELQKSSHYKKSRSRLLLLNYSEKSPAFIRKHFQLDKLSLLTIPEMESLRRLEKTLVAEVNSHFFISESYFLHLGLSRGGTYWGPKVEKEKDKHIVPLSLHHGLEIKTRA